MKFINYLETITGVGIYPLFSLLVFFVFFTALTIWVIKADKGFISTMEHMPLNDNQ
jgi:cytochrome c oxidase cbb3-type subunit 3